MWTVLLGGGIAVCLLGIRRLSGASAQIPAFLAVMTGAFLCYALALLRLRQPRARLSAGWIVAVALAVQLTPLQALPRWDGDAYRYHWDGWLLAHGVSPYAYAPGDHALVALRDQYWPLVEMKAVRTIYPPLDQYLLAATCFLDPSPRRVMLLAVAGNLLCLWPLLLLLRVRGVDDKWLALFAWNPLLAAEFATGGHQDAWSVLLLLAALYALERRRPGLAGGWLGLAVMAKTQVLLVAPLLLWRGGWRAVGLFLLAVLLLCAPLLALPGAHPFDGTLTYATQWENNSSAFAVVRWVAGRLLGGSDPATQWAAGDRAARALVLVVMLALVGYLTFRPGDVLLHVALVLGAALLLGPVFFPWYASWVLPFVCLYPSVMAVAATYLLLAAHLYTYDPALGLTARIPEMILIYAGGLAEFLWRRRAATARLRRESPPAPSATTPPAAQPSPPAATTSRKSRSGRQLSSPPPDTPPAGSQK
jgi:hypothetical protein